MTSRVTWLVVFVLAGCGSKKAPEPTPKKDAGIPIATAIDASTPDAAAVVLKSCTDGGALASAAVTADDVRFCLDEDDKSRSCWGVALAGAAVKPLAVDKALDGATALDVKRDTTGDKPAGVWIATIGDDYKVEVCGTDGCKQLPVILPSKDPNDDRSTVADAAVSASGKHVALVRGSEGVSTQSIEIYDRASGKRLGVAKQKTACIELQGFASESVVAVEWDCANQGGDRLLFAPTGKLVARIARLSTASDPFAQLDGDVWAFSETHTGSIEIYDVTSGRRLGGRELAQFAPVAAHAGRAYAIEPDKARVFVFDKTGAEIATARVPTCRYEWETEAVGPIRLLQPVEELAKAIGAPTKKSKPDEMNMHTAAWTYAKGVTAVVRPNFVNEATGKPVPPWLVVGFRITAPSAHQIKGVGIGSTLDDLKKAFGAHEVKSKTSDTLFVAGNEGDAGGIELTLDGGKVTRIDMGDLVGLD
jgi:hypothetical protein